MTPANDSEIRAFLAHEARQAVSAAPSLDAAVGRLAPRIQERPSHVSQRQVVLLAATLLLIAALGSAIALGTGILRLPLVNEDLPITRLVPSVPASAASSSPQPSPSPTDGLPVSTTYLDWQEAEISSPHATTTSSVQAVTAFADGYIAAGTEYVNEGPAVDQDAAVWLSNDGTSWTAVESQAAFDGGSIVDVAATDQRVVAVGYRLTEVRADEQQSAASVWVSADADSWQRIDGVPGFERIAAVPNGFVAATRGPSGNASQIWTSNDGVTWEQVATEADLDNGLVLGMRVIDGGISGWSDVPVVVAVGSKPGITTPAAWLSSVDDLATWRSGDLYDTRELGFVLDDVAAGRDGLVAVGLMSCCALKAVGSQDGLVWQTLHEPTPAEQSTTMTFITAVPDGFVAFGERNPTSDITRRMTGWTSSDGAEWSVIENSVLDAAADLQFGDAITRPDGALIVVATALNGSEMSPRAWVVRP